jgi:hypothetical protein
LSSAKECVTTHLPKQLALKMDGAQVVCRYNAAKIKSMVDGRSQFILKS